MTGCRFSAIGTATLTVCGLLTWPLVATITGPEVAPSGTRVTTKPSELTTTGPSKSPNFTLGRSSSCGRSPEPLMRTSPPVSAQAGDDRVDARSAIHIFLAENSIGKCHEREHQVQNLRTASLCVARGIRSPILFYKTQAEENLHDCESVNSGRDVIEHDPGPFWKPFQLPHRGRLDDVEDSKKYKAREESFPCTEGRR